jgi:hypothetical protein
MIRGKVFYFGRVSLAEYYYSAFLFKCCFQVMHVMYGLERFHLARSWNGWMMTSNCIMDMRPMMFIVPFSYFSVVLVNSEPFTSMSRTMVCNNGPYGDELL